MEVRERIYPITHPPLSSDPIDSNGASGAWDNGPADEPMVVNRSVHPLGSVISRGRSRRLASPNSAGSRRGGIPLRSLLILCFVVQGAIAVTLTGWLSWRNGQRTVQQLVMDLQTETGDRVKGTLENYLAAPRLAAQLSANEFSSGDRSAQNPAVLERHLFRYVLQLEGVSGLLIGTPQGMLRAVNRRGSLNLLRSEAGAILPQIRTFSLTPEGEIQREMNRNAKDFRQAPWFVQGSQAQAPQWGRIFQPLGKPDFSLNFNVPVRDAQGNLRAVVSSGVVLSVVDQFLQGLDVGPHGEVFVLERDGFLVGNSDASTPSYRLAASATPPTLERIQAIHHRNPLIQQTAQHLLERFGRYEAVTEPTLFSFKTLGMMRPLPEAIARLQLPWLSTLWTQTLDPALRSLGGETQLVRVVPCRDAFGLDWLVVVVMPERDVIGSINRQNWTTLWLCLAALGTAIALGLLLSQRLARPILRLSRAAQAIAQGERLQVLGSAPSQHLLSEQQSVREMRVVAQAFNRMVQQVGQAMETLETQVQDRTRELQRAQDFDAALKKITDRVRDTLDEDQILQAAVEYLALTIGVRGCNAALYNLDRGVSQVQYEYTTFPKRFQGEVLLLRNFPGYGQLLRGDYFQCCGLVPIPNRGSVAMLACPIQDDRGVLGDLWLINPAHYAFGEKEINLVQQVANQCAIAIRQARLYQAAQAQIHELARLNRLKEDFLSTISHELRTPMANIKMATQMLEISLQREGLLSRQGKPPDLASPLQRYFQILKDECQRETRLIEDLLDLSKLEQEWESATVVPVDLVQWLPRVIAPFRERLGDRQQLLLELPERLPLLYTQPEDLERLVLELLENASKHTPLGEAIAVTTTAQGSTLVLQVVNSGVEIPPEERDRIFERFYRIPTADPWQQGGTGLGLALAKGLAQRLGGELSVQSDRSLTTFSVQLPLMGRPLS